MAALANTWRLWRQAAADSSDTSPRLQVAAGWLVSLVVHLAALIVLASLTLWLPAADQVLLSALPVALDEELVPQELHFSPVPEEKVGAAGTGTVGTARPAAPNSAEWSQLEYELKPTAPVGELQVLQFDRTLFDSPDVSEDLLVKGAGSIGTSGVAGALDRLTHEILLSLEREPTLVVWLFDRSRSLAAQREAIADRFDRVYDELSVIEAGGHAAFRQHSGQPLLTAVAAFGMEAQLLTPKPTDDLAEIKGLVRSVEDDVLGGGRENVFSAVRIVAERFRRLRLGSPRRSVMIIVFTDEAGDDLQSLDAAVATCRKHEMPVYVVGVPAPFGRETAYVKWVDPDQSYDQSPQPAPVHQGPESLLPERIKVLYGRNQRSEEQLDSGFGPFGLCRLAHETGGLYFTVHPNREVGRRIAPWETAAMSTYLNAFFDPRIMRNYQPDYVSENQYRRILASNRACEALVQASQLPWIEVGPLRRRFPRIDDGQLARDLSSAQRAVAKAEPEIELLLNLLRQGEQGREKLTQPRWQAGFDLAMGRGLAFHVRTAGYNAILGAAKQGMRFKNEQSDTWELRPSEEVTLSTALAREAADARTYLERVVAEHPETPWALEAAQELREPLGWEWRERFTDVAGRLANANNNVARPQPPTPPAKPRRDPPDL